MKKAFFLLAILLLVISACTYEECVQWCSENYDADDFGFNTSQECVQEFCTDYDNGGNDEIPEFTVIGAGVVLAGAGYYMYRKRN